MDHVTARGLADQALRLDGPYPPGAVVATAGLVAELVRRLNHATTEAAVLPQPSHVHAAIGELAGVVAGLQQLLTQLAARLQQFSADPRRLRHSQHGHVRDSMDFALLDLLHAAADLRRAADASRGTAAAIRSAHARTGYLTVVDADGVR